MNRNDHRGYPTLNAFVRAKITKFNSSEHSFLSLFRMMFSEKDYIFYERSEGYRLLRTTYGEAEQEILRLAAALKTRFSGLPENAFIGLYLPNSLQWLEFFWAILLSGYRPVLMNLRLDRATLEQALADCGAAAVLSDGETFPVSTLNISDIAPAAEPLVPENTGTELLVMSSGTSAHLKLCAYSAEEFWHQIQDSYQIIRTCRQIKKHSGGHLKLLTFLPFYHIFGLVAVYIWFTFFSRTLVQLNDMAPQTILNTVRRHRVTHIFAVPLFWQKVCEQAAAKIAEQGEKTEKKFRKGMDLAAKLGDVPLLGTLFIRVAFREVRRQMFGNSIRFLISGGSEIAPETLAFFNSIGYHLANGYGMSEIGITSVELSSRRSVLSAGFVGKPLSSVQYRVSPEGELQVQADSAACYILEGGVRKDRGGWFSTGDLAECENGRYRILGRRDDVIVSPSGENLNPCLVEQQYDTAGTDGVCIIGEKTANGTEPVLLVSVGRRKSADELEALRRSFAEQTAKLGLAGRIRKTLLTPDPLMTEQEFKLNRRLLAKKYAAGLLRDAADFQKSQALRRDGSALTVRVRELTAAALNCSPESFSDDDDFFDALGGTSLDYLSLTARLQEEYIISFPAAEGNGLRTVRQFADYIKAKRDGYVD